MSADLRSPNQIAISQGLKFAWKRRKREAQERMTAAEYKAAAKPKKRNKFGNKPQTVKGVRFASKAEAKRDAELKLLERDGSVRNLQRQPRFPLLVNGVKVCTYVGDWQYQERVPGGWRHVVEDKKGVQTPAFKIKWALARALYQGMEWRLS